MWFGGGEKWGVYYGVPTQAPLGEMPSWDGILPKEVCMSCDHLIHAIEVGDEVA